MRKSVFQCAHALVVLSFLGLVGCYAKVEVSDSSAEKAIAIDWVEPPCAEPGSEAGYIEGNGFGAENVAITVGGIEAEVLAATGMDASFVVPEELAPGQPIEVVVMNPGGRIATIDWRVCECPVFACTEEGIRQAIAVGGGPHTFCCDGPTTVTTQGEIVIDNDVILDGEGNMTVALGVLERVFSVRPNITVELKGMTVTRTGWDPDEPVIDGHGVFNEGTLTLDHSHIVNIRGPVNSAAEGNGIYNLGALTLRSSSVADNFGDRCVGISNHGTATLIDSVVSGNSGASIGFVPGICTWSPSTLLLINSTVADNDGQDGGGVFVQSGATATIIGSTVKQYSGLIYGAIAGPAQVINSTIQGRGNVSPVTEGSLTNCTVVQDKDVGPYADPTYVSFMGTVTNTIIVGADNCSVSASGGGNIESPGDNCGLTHPTDLVNVTAEELKLGPLADYGGPTETHALGAGSVAIDQIPEADCVDADGAPLTTDQRGFTRPVAILGPEPKCDVGAFEVQP